MGKEAVNVSKDEALSYVFGYTVGNDLSARDLQFRSGQWLLGKTCDHFGSHWSIYSHCRRIGSK